MSSDNDKSDKIDDIILNQGSIIVKLFGIVCPPASTLGIIADAVRERRSKRFVKRLERLIFSLEKRVERLEGISDYTPDVDLFDEIVTKAISDEDESKTEYYAALIEYCMTNKLDPYEVRLLSEAIKGLTIFEIKSFVSFINGQRYDRDIPASLKDVFWNRIEYFALFQGGTVKHATNITSIGKKFIEVHELAGSIE